MTIIHEKIGEDYVLENKSQGIVAYSHKKLLKSSFLFFVRIILSLSVSYSREKMCDDNTLENKSQTAVTLSHKKIGDDNALENESQVSCQFLRTVVRIIHK